MTSFSLTATRAKTLQALTSVLLRGTPRPPRPLEAEVDAHVYERSLVFCSTSFIVNILLVPVIAILFWDAVPLPAMLVWLAINVWSPALTGYTWYAGRRAAARRRAAGKPVRPRTGSGYALLRKVEWASLFYGTTLASGVFLFDFAREVHAVFFIAVIGSAVAVALAIAGPLCGVGTRLLTGGVPVLLAYAAFHPTPLVVSLVLVLVPQYVFMLYSAVRSYSGMVHAFSLSLEAERAKERLEGAIETIDDGFAVFAPDGSAVVENSSYRSLLGDAELTEDETGTHFNREGSQIVEWSRHQSDAFEGEVMLARDVTTERENTARLRRTMEEAGSAESARRRFLHSMTEEFFTPLDAILGFSSMMDSESNIPLHDEDVRLYSDEIGKAGERLKLVLKDMVGFAGQGDGAVESELSDLELQPLLEAELLWAARAHNRADDANRVDLEPGLDRVMADQPKLTRILGALADNAFKFSEAGTVVTLGARLADGHVCFTVSDQGCGIPAGDAKAVFEAFHTLGAEHGLGLGLARARMLCGALKYGLALASEPGKGTHLAVSLSGGEAAAQAAAQAAQAAAAGSGKALAA